MSSVPESEGKEKATNSTINTHLNILPNEELNQTLQLIPKLYYNSK
jgi:hypothetical protein